MANINAVMDGKDTIRGSAGECYFTLNGRRYNGMQVISVEGTMAKTKTEVPILGKSGKGNKATGWRGTGTCRMHYMSPQFRAAAMEFIKNGADLYFDMQVTNEDPTSAAGRQTTILKHCNFDEVLLTRIDASADTLDEEMPFTFDDVEMPETFNELEGM